jgi:hypothetical protein
MVDLTRGEAGKREFKSTTPAPVVVAKPVVKNESSSSSSSSSKWKSPAVVKLPVKNEPSSSSKPWKAPLTPITSSVNNISSNSRLGNVKTEGCSALNHSVGSSTLHRAKSANAISDAASDAIKKEIRLLESGWNSHAAMAAAEKKESKIPLPGMLLLDKLNVTPAMGLDVMKQYNRCRGLAMSTSVVTAELSGNIRILEVMINRVKKYPALVTADESNAATMMSGMYAGKAVTPGPIYPGSMSSPMSHMGGTFRPGMPGPSSGMDPMGAQDPYERPLNDMEQKEALRKLLSNAVASETITPKDQRLPTPPELNIQLLEHQKLGLEWMLKMERGSNQGGILADDMGEPPCVFVTIFFLTHLAMFKDLEKRSSQSPPFFLTAQRLHALLERPLSLHQHPSSFNGSKKSLSALPQKPSKSFCTMEPVEFKTLKNSTPTMSC